jgi:hypothetical protein
MVTLSPMWLEISSKLICCCEKERRERTRARRVSSCFLYERQGISSIASKFLNLWQLLNQNWKVDTALSQITAISTNSAPYTRDWSVD